MALSLGAPQGIPFSMHVIAVVDDEEPARRSLARLLRSAGYEVALFAGGEEFFEWLGRSRGACVLVDGQMPADIAADLGVTPAAVRKAKSRVLHRLRQEIGDLIA